MTVSGGEVDFKYDHDVYWPALEKITTERRQQRKERWVKGGKLIGENEVYLWGGEESSIEGNASNQAGSEIPASTTTSETPGAQAKATEDDKPKTVTDDVALANGFERLDVASEEPKQTQEQEQGQTVSIAA